MNDFYNFYTRLVHYCFSVKKGMVGIRIVSFSNQVCDNRQNR